MSLVHGVQPLSLEEMLRKRKEEQLEQAKVRDSPFACYSASWLPPACVPCMAVLCAEAAMFLILENCSC